MRPLYAYLSRAYLESIASGPLVKPLHHPNAPWEYRTDPLEDLKDLALLGMHEEFETHRAGVDHPLLDDYAHRARAVGLIRLLGTYDERIPEGGEYGQKTLEKITSLAQRMNIELSPEDALRLRPLAKRAFRDYLRSDAFWHEYLGVHVLEPA